MRPCYRALSSSPRIAFTGNSHAGSRDYANWIGVPPSTVHTIPNAIDEAIVNGILKLAQLAAFGCLVIDTDGEVESDIDLYRPVLSPNAYLIVDDYYAAGNPDKEEKTRREVDALVRRGVIEAFGVHGWGTWFGRFA